MEEIAEITFTDATHAEALRNCARRAQKFADSVVQGAPGALVETKRLIEELWSSPVEKDIDLALKYHMNARESAEAREGIAAFNEKRLPRWAE